MPRRPEIRKNSEQFKTDYDAARYTKGGNKNPNYADTQARRYINRRIMQRNISERNFRKYCTGIS